MVIFVLLYKRYVSGAYTTETAARAALKARAAEKGYDLFDFYIVETNLES